MILFVLWCSRISIWCNFIYKKSTVTIYVWEEKRVVTLTREDSIMSDSMYTQSKVKILYWLRNGSNEYRRLDLCHSSATGFLWVGVLSKGSRVQKGQYKHWFPASKRWVPPTPRPCSFKINTAGVKKNNDLSRIMTGGHFSTKRNYPRSLFYVEKWPFCLKKKCHFHKNEQIYVKKNDPCRIIWLPYQFQYSSWLCVR